MRVSTKGRYALRMMIEFGLNPDQCTKISQVAARQGISDKYLEQIVSLLHKAGYVRSIRGAQGGYMLTRKPEEYTVGMILRAAEGSLAPVSCLDEDINHCEHAGRCTTLTIWQQLKDAIDNVVDNTTLADLIEEQKNMPDANLMQASCLCIIMHNLRQDIHGNPSFPRISCLYFYQNPILSFTICGTSPFLKKLLYVFSISSSCSAFPVLSDTVTSTVRSSSSYMGS